MTRECSGGLLEWKLLQVLTLVGTQEDTGARTKGDEDGEEG